jgi:membrane-associated protein
MQEWLIQFVTHHEYLVYIVLVVFACIEGPILSVLCGILIRLGYFHFFPIYIALMVGDLLGDVFWYQIGGHFGRRLLGRFGKYISLTEERIEKVSQIFHRHKDRILVLSKMTNGFGFALVTLITAGIVKVPFRRYMAFNFLGQFVWSAFLIGVGYFFAHAYATVNTVLERVSVVALFAIAIGLFFGFVKYLQNRANAL